MSNTAENSTQKEKEPTQAEIAKYQEQQIAYIKKNLPFLEMQARYTGLLATIEENQVRKLEAKLRYAKYSQSQPTAEDMKKMAEEMAAKEEEAKKKAAETKTA